jgi:two-component system, NtrC family, response regulator HydG
MKEPIVKGRILLVDDNEAFLDSTKDVLEDEGYDIVTASSGDEAIKRVENQPFDLVLMDIKMPGLSGVEAFVEIKKRTPDIKVIMCTAYIVEALIKKALTEGAYAVLNKPFEMSLLFRTIDNALGSPKFRASILVADSDPALCTTLQDLLASEGNNVFVANDGHAALELAHERKFDILLVDADLPLIKGPELHRLIKAKQPDLLATIIMSASQDLSPDLHSRLAREKGVTKLTKPLDLAQLKELLDSIRAAEHNRT